MAGALAPLPARAAYAAIEVLWTLARESARGRRVEGRMVAVAVDPGGADPVSAARRVLLDLAVCATPNTFSTGLDRDAGVMVVHQLATSGPQPLPPVRL